MFNMGRGDGWTRGCALEPQSQTEDRLGSQTAEDSDGLSSSTGRFLPEEALPVSNDKVINVHGCLQRKAKEE